MAKIHRVIVLPDPHFPAHNPKSIAAVKSLMKGNRFDEWICLGDLMDFNCISSHNIGNLRAVEGQRILSDYKIAGEFLDRQTALLRRNNKNAKMVLIQGNHDERVSRYIDANPAVEGMLEVEIALELARRKIEWVPFWTKGTVYRIGKASFIHGTYCCDHHAKKHCMAYGTNIFYGHVHDVQSYSLVRYGAETLIGQSLGCLCAEQPWMRGRPDRWVQSVSIFQFDTDGNFQYEVLRITDGKIIFMGKGYSA